VSFYRQLGHNHILKVQTTKLAFHNPSTLSLAKLAASSNAKKLRTLQSKGLGLMLWLYQWKESPDIKEAKTARS
jgi:hypothetical protein